MVVPSHLKSLQALELAMRTGSVRAAADQLAITPAAVGQRIKTLEEYLGVDLVARGRSGLKPAPALARAMPALARAFRDLAEAAEALELQRVHQIQVAASSDWAELWLAPRLPRFRTAFPNAQFCINGEGDFPMRLGRTDVEVDFGPPKPGEEVSVLFRDFLIPVASPENADRARKAMDQDLLEGFPLLHLDAYRDDPTAIDWPKWIAVHGHRTAAAQRGNRFQRIAFALEATLSHAGFMICGLAMITDRLRSGELVMPFPVETGAWTTGAYVARFRRGSGGGEAQLRAFRAWLEAEARQTVADVAEFAGPPP